jgi:O-antigen/teichoic acid export membrane protein
MLKKFALHVSRYSIGNLLVMISAFVSFPILTRVFTVDEYGTLSLISATLALLVGVAKLGVQHSIVRYYGEVKSSGLGEGLARYRSTALYGMTAVAAVVTVVWAITSQIIPASWWGDRRITGLLLLTSVLIVVRAADSCLTNFLRAEEHSGMFSLYGVAKRYVGLAAILFTLFFVARDLYGFYWATIISETGAVLVLFLILRRRGSYPMQSVSLALYRKMLVFGMPMIAYELAGVTLMIGDRYVIEFLLGSSALGVYSAGYNLCEYIQVVLLASIGQAIVPMYVRCWEEEGEEETGRLVRRALHYYLMLALPVFAGLWAVGGDLLVFLASAKYSAGASVIPYVAGGMAIDAGVTLVGAGLYIHKRTFVFAGIAAGCAVLNVLLNLGMVPYWGITGAAAATLISYVALAVSVFIASTREMPLSFPWSSALKFGALSAAMYAVVASCPRDGGVPGLVTKIVVGVVVYGGLLVAFEPSARTAIRLGLAWRPAKD